MKTLCMLLLVAVRAAPVCAEPITVRFVGRVTDRSEQLTEMIKVNAWLKGAYTFDPAGPVPPSTSVAVKVGYGVRWRLAEDPSNAISEDPDGRISVIGGNAIVGSLIEDQPVLVMQLDLLRLPYTLGFQTGQLFLFYVDKDGVYKTASVSF